jgi:hypothetical protein
MGAGGEEFAQPRRRARYSIRSRDADDVKTERAGGLGERRLERGAG